MIHISDSAKDAIREALKDEEKETVRLYIAGIG